MRYLPQPPSQAHPTSLDDHVDWLTYSHQQLYDMVNGGIDLTQATSVSATWATLAERLAQIGTDLHSALGASADGWHGTAADQARNAISALVTWAAATSDNANRVSGCVVREVENVQRARNAMPEPVSAVPSPPITHPVAHPATAPGGTSLSGYAPPPEATPPTTGSLAHQQVAHQQAAQVMAQFQADSRDVYSTVPQFASPTSPVGRSDPRPPTSRPTPTPPRSGPGPVAGPQPVAGPRPVAAPVGSPGGVSGGAVSGGALTGGGVSGGAASGGAPAAVPDRSGIGPASTGGTGSAAPTDPGARSAQGGMMGGMGGGGRRTEDAERRAPKYLEEDADIFTSSEDPAPPVIGADW